MFKTLVQIDTQGLQYGKNFWTPHPTPTPPKNGGTQVRRARGVKIKNSFGDHLSPKMIISQEVRHLISYHGPCYANDTKGGGVIWRLRLHLISQPLFQGILGRFPVTLERL